MTREAIILAGGLGTRLKPLVKDIPKPMALINGRPFLEILIKHLVKNNFKRVILSIGYKSQYIIDYFSKEDFGTEIIFSKEEDMLGTGGAIKLGISHATEDCIFVFNGDTFADINYDLVESTFNKINKSILCGIFVKNVSRYGSISFKDNNLLGFEEKGSNEPGIINAGVYYLKTNQLDDFTEGLNFSFEQDFLAIKKNFEKIGVCNFEGIFIDIGIPEDYIISQTLLKKF